MKETALKKEAVINQIEKIYGFSMNELTGLSRDKNIVKARSILCACLHKIGLTKSEIARLLKRDHTTVIYAIEKVNVLWKKDQYFKDEIEKIKLDPIDITEVKHPYLGNSKKWQWVYNIYKGKCAICGFSDVVQIHHIIPKAIGGKDDIENLIVLCPNHHALLHMGLVDIKELSTRN